MSAFLLLCIFYVMDTTEINHNFNFVRYSELYSYFCGSPQTYSYCYSLHFKIGSLSQQERKYTLSFSRNHYHITQQLISLRPSNDMQVSYLKSARNEISSLYPWAFTVLQESFACFHNMFCMFLYDNITFTNYVDSFHYNSSSCSVVRSAAMKQWRLIHTRSLLRMDLQAYYTKVTNFQSKNVGQLDRVLTHNAASSKNYISKKIQNLGIGNRGFVKQPRRAADHKYFYLFIYFS